MLPQNQQKIEHHNIKTTIFKKIFRTAKHGITSYKFFLLYYTYSNVQEPT